MKVKTLTVLAGGMLLAGSANAAFTGLSTEGKDNGFGLWVCNVYACFDNPNDVMVAVAGTPGNPMSINVNGGTFYQNDFGGDNAPNAALFAVFPSLEYDSFVTIGKKTSLGDQTGLTPGWPGFGASSLGGTNLGWFITPDQAQGVPVDGKVLIGQFSTGDGTGITGTMLVQAVSDGDAGFQAYVSFDHSIPAPGALALLGLAGLAGTRRRR